MNIDVGIVIMSLIVGVLVYLGVSAAVSMIRRLKIYSEALGIIAGVLVALVMLGVI